MRMIRASSRTSIGPWVQFGQLRDDIDLDGTSTVDLDGMSQIAIRLRAPSWAIPPRQSLTRTSKT